MKDLKYTFDVSFQNKILAVVLRDPVFLKEFRDALNYKWFEHPYDQLIARHALDYFDRYREVPTKEAMRESLFLEITKGNVSVEQRTEVFGHLDDTYGKDISDCQFVKDRTTDWTRLQSVKLGIHESLELLDKAQETNDQSYLLKTMSVMQTALMRGTVANTGIEVFSVLQDLRKIHELDPLSSPERRIRTTLPTLDRYLNGGLGPGEIGMVTGESGSGKSTMLCFLATMACLMHKKVVYISFELKTSDIVSKMLAASTHCSIDDVEARTPEFMRKLETLRRLRGHYFKVIFMKPSQATTISIRTALSRIMSMEGVTPDLLVVDYVDEMRSIYESRGEESTYQAFGQITSELQEIGLDFQCAVWTATQLNRTGYGVDAGLQHVGESMKKVNKSDIFLALLADKDEERRGEMRVKILKVRRGAGRNMYVRVKAHKEQARFREIVQRDPMENVESGQPEETNGSDQQ